MAVLGGLCALDSDEEFEPAVPRAHTLPTVAYLTPRPWVAMY